MRFTLLSARTLRACAYATVLMRHPGVEVALVEYGSSHLPAMNVLPDLSSSMWSPLPEWLRVNWVESYEKLRERRTFQSLDEELNSGSTQLALRETNPDIVLFSGSAGNLVGPTLLEIAPFLHMHPGQLPEYRGSTTIYWSLLAGHGVTVSAIYLEPKIDQGGLITTKTFPNPNADSDIDKIYDPGVRAWLLDEVLSQSDDLPASAPQPVGGRDHYVIHPVLKSVVVQRLQKGGGVDEGD